MAWHLTGAKPLITWANEDQIYRCICVTRWCTLVTIGLGDTLVFNFPQTLIWSDADFLSEN